MPGAAPSLDLRRNQVNVILATLLVVLHAPLLLIQWSFWDGNIIHFLGMQRRYDDIMRIFLEAGAPETGLFHSFLLRLPSSMILYRVLALLSLTIFTCSYTYFADRVLKWPSGAILASGLVLVSSPILYLGVEIILVPMLWYLAIFAMSLCVFYSVDILQLLAWRRRQWLWLVVSTTGLAYSLKLNSLLVLFPVLVFLTDVTLYRRSSFEWTYRLFYSAFLVVFVFLASNFFFPKHNEYASYNQIRSEESWKLFRAFGGWFGELWSFWFNDLRFLTCIFLLVAVAAAFQILREFRWKQAALMFSKFGVVNSFLVVSSIIPYVLVGVTPSWGTLSERHLLLLVIPVTVSIGMMSSRVSTLASKFLIVGAVVGLFGLQVYALWDRYSIWIFREAFERAVLQELRIQESQSLIFKNVAVVRLTGSTELPEFDVGLRYGWHEWTNLFKLAGSEGKILVYDSRYSDQPAPGQLRVLPIELRRRYGIDGLSAEGECKEMNISLDEARARNLNSRLQFIREAYTGGYYGLVKVKFHSCAEGWNN